MDKDLYGPKSGEGALLWFLKAVSGLLVLVVLGIHFIVNHFVASEGLLSYTDVLKYYQNPVIPVMEILFLVFVVSHSLLGLRGILLDLKPSRAVLGVVNWALSIFGVAAILYGSWLILAIVAEGMAL
jgi:succinate dehydrogenase / fumarate reductase, membrane anchor subunit